MSVTVGDFLKEKANNLARWVTLEVGKENLPVDLEQLVSDRTALELTCLAEALKANSSKVVHRDWRGLVGAIERERLPMDLGLIVHAVRSREYMHDKFWRYMELFIAVIGTDSSDAQVDSHATEGEGPDGHG